MTTLAQPTTLGELQSIAQQMANNPADAIALAAQLQTLARNLPPERSALMSRPEFARASLWNYAASFEMIPATQTLQQGPQVIRVTSDVWVRGLQAQAILQTSFQNGQGLAGVLTPRVPNHRWAFDLNWRIDGKQGFVSSGTAEIFWSAEALTGDGVFSVPLDWKLQTDQTIEVSIVPKLVTLMAGFVTEEGAIWEFLRWVVLNFWVEDLGTPSIQR
jgi:hypothetical protein